MKKYLGSGGDKRRPMAATNTISMTLTTTRAVVLTMATRHLPTSQDRSAVVTDTGHEDGAATGDTADDANCHRPAAQPQCDDTDQSHEHERLPAFSRDLNAAVAMLSHFVALALADNGALPQNAPTNGGAATRTLCERSW
jgi:hypothetical protein